MIDQATKLRELKGKTNGVAALEKVQLKPKTIAITSGKGGVGKSHFALNWAISLSHLGKRVLLFDADINLANLDILLGINPRYTLRNVISDQKTLSEIILEGPAGIKIISASSGAMELVNIQDKVKKKLIDNFAELESHFDLVVIDTAAGLSRNVLEFVLSSEEIIVITTPEPTAITDAYAMIKIIHRQRAEASIRLLVNLVEAKAEAEQVFEKLNLVIEHFLKRKIEFLGFVVADKHVSQAVHRQTPFLLAYPESPASVCVTAIARNFCDKQPGVIQEDVHLSLFQKLFKRESK